MKTLEEVVADVELPLPSWTEHAFIANPVKRKATEALACRAANAFPKLVRFVEAQRCECVVSLVGGSYKPVDPKCPRCALLEEVLA